MKSSALLLAIALPLTGCWSTTVHNSPVGATPRAWDERWHSGMFFGSVELSGPYDLASICPSGWSEIQTKTSPWNGLLILLTFDTYSTQTVTVRCAPGKETARNE
jgi:hypothetical protein